MNLREQIEHAIRSKVWPTNDDQVEGIDDAAEAVLAIPEIADALKTVKPLGTIRFVPTDETPPRSPPIARA